MTPVEGPPSRQTGPRELALRIQAGEAAAEAELFERYRRGVSIIVQRMVRDSCIADDLCQDTFRLVLEKVRRGELRDPQKLSGFICNIARYLAIEHLRQPRRTQPLGEPGLSVPDPKPDPLSTLIEREKMRAIRQVLQEMSLARDREVLRRFYLEEEDKESICADLDLSSLQFNRVVFRARERFRELYQQGGKRQ